MNISNSDHQSTNNQTDHSLQANRLNEAVQDLRKGVSRHLRPPHRTRISIHAQLPITAYHFQRRQPLITATPILHVIFTACRHLGEDLRHSIIGGLVDVGFDGGPEAVDHVQAAEAD